MLLENDTMNLWGDSFFLPLTLIINFSLFQYLLTFYFKRRAEPRGILLILSAFGGFASLVPYAHPNEEMVGHLNDVSETCSALTFLIQIVIVGRDVNKKVRIRSLKFVSIAGEILIGFGLLVVLVNFIEIMGVDTSAFDGVDGIFEDITLWFIFFARFFYIVISRGFKETVRTRKVDVFLYMLFVTHEYPFMILESVTGYSWVEAQALWNRLTIMFCIMLTIREKLRSSSSKQSKLNTNKMGTTQGPQEKSIYVSDADPTGPSVNKTTWSFKPAKSAPSFKAVLVSGASVKPFSGRK